MLKFSSILALIALPYVYSTSAVDTRPAYNIALPAPTSSSVSNTYEINPNIPTPLPTDDGVINTNPNRNFRRHRRRRHISRDTPAVPVNNNVDSTSLPIRPTPGRVTPCESSGVEENSVSPTSSSATTSTPDVVGLSDRVPIRTCGSNPALVINELEISPFRPMRRETPTRFSIRGELKKDITAGATMNVVVRFNGLKLLDKTVDICQSIEDHASCPIRKGKFNYADVVKIPGFVPAGQFEITFSARSGDSKDNIFCGTVTAELR